MTTKTKTVYMKKGDLEPALDVTFEDANGALTFTGAETIKFFMRLRNSSTCKIDGTAAAWVSAAAGTATYSWSGTDTNAPGVYHAEFEVTYASGRKCTFPNCENLLVVISDSVEV